MAYSDNAKKPERINAAKKPMVLLNTLLDEMENKTSGGIYEAIQIDFAFESNAMADNKLTKRLKQFTKQTPLILQKSYNTDDIIETINHFKCFDLILENVTKQLNETFIKATFHSQKWNHRHYSWRIQKLPHEPFITPN